MEMTRGDVGLFQVEFVLKASSYLTESGFGEGSVLTVRNCVCG